MPPDYSLRYPRRVVFRGFVRLVGRALMALFTRTTVTGKHLLPTQGPLILVGNHADVIEAALMALYVPWPVEFVGTGDIPLDPRFAWIMNSYGYIPVNRGNLDRKGLNAALDVLKQGGVVGIFPEGGIWQSGGQSARTGVAWLSHMGNAPVVPIAFGGVRGALGKAFALKRPRLTMTIGAPLPPVNRDVPGASRKAALEGAANAILAAVMALLPEDERRPAAAVEERYEFDLLALASDGSTRSLGAAFSAVEREALGLFLSRPMIVRTFIRNLKLPARPLQQLETPHAPADIARAADAVVAYLNNGNPQFLNYRFGYATGGAMKDALAKLGDAARDRAAAGERIILKVKIS